MFNNFNKTLYIPIWLIPVALFYGYILFEMNFYSLGNWILAILFSGIIIAGLTIVSSSIYESIQEDVVSEIPPSQRSASAAIKMHILVLFLLAINYTALMVGK